MSHTKPGNYEIENKIVIKENSELVWNNLIKTLSSSYFVVNNIAKESKFINISYSTNLPEKYIDCGETVRETWRGTKTVENTKKYSYATAGSNSLVLEGKVHPSNSYFEISYLVDRKTNLEGRINIYVSAYGSDARFTEIIVNIKYIFSLALKTTPVATHTNNRRLVYYEPSTTENFDFNFTTAQRSVPRADEITCTSNGSLEREILDIIRQKE